MPVYLTSLGSVSVSPYDVLGQFSSEGILTHAMLCEEQGVRDGVTAQTQLSVAHMGPPLGKQRASSDAIGSAELNASHKRKIKTFVDDRLLERKAEEMRLAKLKKRTQIRREYCIFPDAVKPTADFPLWRFSCVGFVIQAYRRARVVLLDSSTPLSTLDEVKQLYPSLADSLDNQDERHQLGLIDGTEWPIRFVGYLFHSLARTVEEIRGPNSIPYTPQKGDERYPKTIESDST